ncbi:DUF305 domain-containing protein [Orbaceae bacterium ESL0727]|nr:DUF305 domain-containing protein [Orbaceae bacterium ESL0727]
MKKSILALCMMGVMGLSGMAVADEMANMKADAVEAKTEMQKELVKSMGAMHAAMSKSLTYADADKAFAVGMTAHHEGAIEMAKIELKYGKDPEMRKLAEQIIKAQGPEIDEMKAWLKK